MRKYLDFYKKCMLTGEIPESERGNTGLCGALGKRTVNRFTPSKMDCLSYGVRDWGYWANDKDLGFQYSTGFGPTRQNIVLFLAAMNGEL